jgi:hypothetical protein
VDIPVVVVSVGTDDWDSIAFGGGGDDDEVAAAVAWDTSWEHRRIG